MCSTTSQNSSGGIGGGGGGRDNGGSNGGDGCYSRQSKRQKLPKRGPGVAELEKILRKQEQKIEKSEGLSAPLPFFEKPNDGLVIDFDHVSPPNTFYSNCNGKNGAEISESYVHLREQALFPINCDERRSSPRFPFSTPSVYGSRPNLTFHDPSLIERSRNTPASVKNLFTLPVVSQSSTTHSVASHGRETPSSQAVDINHFTSFWGAEDETSLNLMMFGANRSKPFGMEIPPVPVFRYPVPTLTHQVSRLDSSSFLSKNAISREMKPNNFVESNLKNWNLENGSEGNFLSFGSTTTPPTHILNLDRQKFNHFHSQETNGGGAIHNMPFYSFLEPRKQQIGMVENEIIEARGDGIDLSLKL